MKYELIVFDFDGTLADTYPWFASVINLVADKYQFKRIDDSEADTMRGYGALEIISHLDIPLWKLPIIAKHMRSLMAKDINKITLFEGVDFLLQKLTEKGVKLGIVSSNACDNISRILGNVNMSYIDFSECGSSMFGKVSKLKKILKKSGVDNKYSIFIGDELRDIEAAKKVNISSGVVSWGYNKIQILKEKTPDEVFLNMNEILEIA